jgi:hypothetical protein
MAFSPTRRSNCRPSASNFQVGIETRESTHYELTSSTITEAASHIFTNILLFTEPCSRRGAHLDQAAPVGMLSGSSGLLRPTNQLYCNLNTKKETGLVL